MFLLLPSSSKNICEYLFSFENRLIAMAAFCNTLSHAVSSVSFAS